MDEIDRKMLTKIQTGFPICACPYQLIANELNISEQEVIARIKKLKDGNLIRRIGAIFDSQKLGYVSTLCAAKVAQEQFDDVVNFLNSLNAVTHNYLRDHYYNVWFTLIVAEKEQINTILEELKANTGVSQVLELPALQRFKIKVDFNMHQAGEHN